MTNEELRDGGETLIPLPPDPTGLETPVSLELSISGQSIEGANLVSSSAVGQRMVQIALTQVGVGEAGGEDRGIPFERYVRPFGLTQPVPWCACFVSWSYWQTTSARPPWSNPAYVGSVRSWAQQHGRLVTNPSQGDMFGIGDQHMGLVVARRLDGHVVTVEGNWGDRVISQKRPISGLWFATPTYP